MMRQLTGFSLFFLINVLPGTTLPQTSPGPLLPGPTPDQPAVFEVKVRDVYTGYAVPATITITPRIPEPPGEVGVRVPPDVFTGPPGRGEVFLRRGGPPIDLLTQEPPIGDGVDVPSASPPGFPDPGRTLPEQSVPLAPLEPLRSLMVRTGLDGSASFPLEAPGRYEIAVSVGGYEPLTADFSIETNIKPQVVTYRLTPQSLPTTLLPETLAAKEKNGFIMTQGYVVDVASGRPLAGASIILTKSGIVTNTNQDGYFSFYTPVLAMQEGDPEQLPPIDDLTAKLKGYKFFRLLNTRLGNHTVLEMEAGKGETVYDHEGDRRSHGTSSGEVGQDGALALTPENLMPTVRVASRDVTPQIVDGSPQNPTRGIVVGYNCSTASTCSSQETMLLETYILRGLDDEWPASWTKDSLKAGAVAYRTYAAYHMRQRDIGPPTWNAKYDICNTPVCQKNIYPWSFPVSGYPNYQPAVTETKGIILTVDGTVSTNVANAWRVPAKTEYSATINGVPNTNAKCTDNEPPKTTCPCEPQEKKITYCKADEGYGDGWAGSPSTGWPCMAESVAAGRGTGGECFGHNRGMSQNGSYWWTLLPAPDKKDWKWIVNHYYNNNGVPVAQRSIFFATEAARRVARGAEGRLHTFIWASDYTYKYKAQVLPSASSFTSSSWTPLSGCLIANPVAATTDQGDIHVFGQGCDKGLWRNVLGDPNPWSRIDIGNGAPTVPADGSPAWLVPDVLDVLRDKNGKFVLFKRDVSHRVWRAEQQSNGTFRWIFNNDHTEGDSPPEGIRNTDSRASLQTFMNVGGAVFTAYQFPNPSECSAGPFCGSPPGAWGSFAAILSRPDDGTTPWDIFGSPFPIVDKNGKWELFVTACNRYTPAQGCALWVNRKTKKGPGWWDTTGWIKIGGNFVSDPDGAINASGGLQVFAVGSDYQLYYWWQSAPESTPWRLGVIPAPAGITWASVPNVLRNTDGSLQVFIKGSNNALWSSREISPASATSAGTWSAWENLGESLRDF